MMLLSVVRSDLDDSSKCVKKVTPASMYRHITANDAIMHVDQVEPCPTIVQPQLGTPPQFI
eukprot:237053-Ditylum_brightwellii.AAC.1